ncbi:MAG: DEDD exonuclease domain-containing protein [Acidothermus cellulolyticus]|nr:DEDD exonuclease domain-containing protein [Acidothermus cellulolyticus]
MTSGPVPGFRQTTIDDLDTPLRDVTFVVVDLETTGGAPGTGAITELAAVKVRGGEVLGELQTLVNPGRPIPPFITVLTGITDAMVAPAPPIDAVLPTFLEFAAGSVLVAHNAPFDVGFLRAACAAAGYDWPEFEVLDTARLARRVLTREEAPNCTLATLARVFRAKTTPNHRALADVYATIDVLHGLLERLGSFGVGSLADVRTFSAKVTATQRQKRHLAERLPHAPGVYLFRDRQGRVLYVGKAKDLRQRVRSYFTAAETRGRIVDMLRVAEDVTPIVCATELEAEIREVRLIAEHKPAYNRRSKFPERTWWVKLTDERFPRLAVVHTVRSDAATYLGPFNVRESALLAVEALQDAFPIRRCPDRLGPRTRRPPCAWFELGRCGAPCTGAQSPDAYRSVVAAVHRAMTSDPSEVVAAALRRITPLAAAQRYEEAVPIRDRLVAYLHAVGRAQRLAALAGCRQIVAARPGPDGAWDVAVIRHGRLAGAGLIPAGEPDVDRQLTAIVATASTPLPRGVGITAYADAEEMELLLRWLDQPGVRLLDVEGTWAIPINGGLASNHVRIAA